jgi:hypothetical protein
MIFFIAFKDDFPNYIRCKDHPKESDWQLQTVEGLITIVLQKSGIL